MEKGQTQYLFAAGEMFHVKHGDKGFKGSRIHRFRLMGGKRGDERFWEQFTDNSRFHGTIEPLYLKEEFIFL